MNAHIKLFPPSRSGSTTIWCMLDATKKKFSFGFGAAHALIRIKVNRNCNPCNNWSAPNFIHIKGNKKLSWCWQTRATRLEVNQGHQTVAFHMLGIVASCAIVNLSLYFFTIFAFSNTVTLKSGSKRLLQSCTAALYNLGSEVAADWHWL